MHPPEIYMRRCLELAQRGKGRVSPNPMVGAVLVYDGRIIGEGWHQQLGNAHAEVACIENVAAEDKYLIPRSTMYVSLEPCSHWGRTPPCAERIVEEGIRQIVVCNDDPFPKVDGRGFGILQDAGVEVERGVLQKEGRWMNRRFFCAQEQKRPYIILKWAQTANGFFAPLNRTRNQMSNRLSQSLVHRWRTEDGAILVGTQTALNDDPQLTARLWDGPQPLRIALDKTSRLPHSLRLMNNDAETMIVTEATTGEKHVSIPFDEELLPSILQEVLARGKQSLIVEGGANTLQGFIDASLWDEARVFITPPLLQSGIAAPLLNASEAFMKTELGTDTMQCYTRTGNAFPYASGMEL